MGSLLSATLYATYSSQVQSSSLRALEKKYLSNSSQQELEVEGLGLIVHPWQESPLSIQELEDWEFRRVKIRGELSKTTHFVYRERNGEKGYLLFKALVTSTARNSHNLPSKNQTEANINNGVMVNIGWIPATKIVQLRFDEPDFIKKIEAEPEKAVFAAQVMDPYTGYVYNSESEEEELEFPRENLTRSEVEVTGYLRKSEEHEPLIGQVNITKQNVMAQVDLQRIASFYQLANLESSSRYYLQVAINRKPEDLVDELVCPASLYETRQDIEVYIKRITHPSMVKRNMGLMASLVTSLGLVL